MVDECASAAKPTFKTSAYNGSLLKKLHTMRVVCAQSNICTPTINVKTAVALNRVAIEVTQFLYSSVFHATLKFSVVLLKEYIQFTQAYQRYLSHPQMYVKTLQVTLMRSHQ